jgi:6-phosphogluconolactonase
MKLHIEKNTSDLSASLANFVSERSAEAIVQRGVFHVAVSGGSLPAILGAKLKDDPYRSSIEWSKWQVWFVDERHVPIDHNDSNFKEVQKSLLSSVPIPQGNVHIADSSLPLDKNAEKYETDLRKFFPNLEGGKKFPELDLILLGMGPDGHTASLFPNHPLLKESEKWIASISDSPKPPPQRITFTLPLINAGRHVAFVAAGEAKKDLVLQVIEGNPAWGTVPSKVVAPTSKNLHWFLDEPAASLLTKSKI